MKVSLDINFSDSNTPESFQWQVEAEVGDRVESSAGHTLVIRSNGETMANAKQDIINAMFDLTSQLIAARGAIENF